MTEEIILVFNVVRQTVSKCCILKMFLNLISHKWEGRWLPGRSNTQVPATSHLRVYIFYNICKPVEIVGQANSPLPMVKFGVSKVRD